MAELSANDRPHVSGPAPRVISAARRRRALLLALGLVAVLGAVTLEVVVRLFVPVTDVPLYFWDPTLGVRRGPNQAGNYLNGWDVRGRYHFNAQGWNDDREYVVQKPSGTRRVCIIGDSQVEALQVQPDEAMHRVAEAEMARGGPVEWYAFGCSGWGTQHEYECIRRYVVEYQPDLVILLFVQNDPFDASPYISAIEDYSVAYWLDDSDQLTFSFPTNYKPSRIRRLASNSALVRLFFAQHDLPGKLSAWLSGRKVVAGVGQLPLRQSVESARSDRVPGLTNLTLEQRQQKTWKLIEKLLEAMRDECARRGARFAVASRGWAFEIDAPVSGLPYVAPPREADPYCLDTRASEMCREQVAPICDRLGIPYLDLTDALKAEVERTKQSHRFPKDNHYCALGHRAAGKALAAFATRILDTSAGEKRPAGRQP